MQAWKVALYCAALSWACVDTAAAQGVLGPLIPQLVPGPNMFEPSDFPEAKPFGNDGKALPGVRVDAAKVRGKWVYRAVKRNAQFGEVRVPQFSTVLLLDLQASGRYTLDYYATWGLANGDPEGQFAGREAHERGRFSVSGSVLLLEAEAIELTEQIKGKPKTESTSTGRRAYVVRQDTAGLNVAGVCPEYQAEDVCKYSRSVWFPLRSLTATSKLGGR